MEITAGQVCGLKLSELPDNHDIRPTSVRARRAFFDQLGPIDGITFADCFAGSGMMGMEAASRGASTVISAEEAQNALNIIQKNAARMTRAGLKTEFITIAGALPSSLHLRRLPQMPDIVFADPPYLKSMDMLGQLTADPFFNDWTKSATLYWELPDFPCELRPPADPWRLTAIRQLGPTRFLILRQNV